ncbi:hypothetical protein VUR80DRAFT_2932 [Thermomyces stellatus]
MSSSPRLTLYRANGACSIIPHSVLLHYGIPFTSVLMQPGAAMTPAGIRYVAADGSLTHEDYLAINPAGYVPALVVGEGAEAKTITETPALLTYISSLVPQAKLLGDGLLQQTKVVEWMNWLSGTLHSRGFSMYVFPGRVIDDENAHPAVKLKAQDLILKGFARIDEWLRGKEFAVGDGLTVVDFYLYPFWMWGLMNGFDLEPYPTYAQYAKRIESLEGVRKALAAEGIPPSFE